MSLHHLQPRALTPAHIQPEDQLRHVGEPLGLALVNLDRAAAKRSGLSVIDTLAQVGGWEAPEHDSERYRMLEAALASRGMPWRSGGGEGMHDAWSLVRECAQFATQRDGIDVERPYAGWGVSESKARKVLTQWGLTEVKTRYAAPGDVLLFDVPQQDLGGGRTFDGGFHAAILSEPGGDLSWSMLPTKKRPAARMVHTFPARAVIESFVSPLWRARLVAAFSFDTPFVPGRAALKVAA